MKNFLFGFVTLVMAIIVSVLMFSVGTIYSLLYSIWLTITLKKWYAFFEFWWNMFDGYLHSLGNLLYEIAYFLDLCWNVNGEILEDLITSEENTTFGNKDISVSATTGKLVIDNKINTKFGKFFVKLLNVVFNQEQHAVDAWYFTKFRKELKDRYFAKRTSKMF